MKRELSIHHKEIIIYLLKQDCLDGDNIIEYLRTFDNDELQEFVAYVKNCLKKNIEPEVD